MDEQAIRELTAQAGLALLVFGTAAMALLELVRGVLPSLNGTKAGVVAKLLSVAAVVVVLADAMPMLGFLTRTVMPGWTRGSPGVVISSTSTTYSQANSIASRLK